MLRTIFIGFLYLFICVLDYRYKRSFFLFILYFILNIYCSENNFENCDAARK